VNHPGGKNLIGAFHQPVAVIADTGTLRTLPGREFCAGMAEVIKYGCIHDALFLDWLDAHMEDLLARNPEALTHAISRSCEIKAAVVAGDEREAGRRAVLNFGHTFGHAIEAATGYTDYLHGEAVAIGMVIAADLSHRLGLLDAAAAGRVKDVIARARLPTAAPRIGAARAAELMHMDKKVLAGNIRLVLLDKLGGAVITGRFDPGALAETLEGHFS
jgi:3-dehydroquinate synthase